MSHRLRVRVRLYSTVMEDRVLRVRDRVRLGEAPDARVSFPGADLVVGRGDDGVLRVRGRPLRPGEVVRVHLGPVEVELEALPTALAGWRREIEDLLGSASPIPDPRLFLATASIALAAAFWDSASSFVENDPEVAARIAALFGTGPAGDATGDANASNAARSARDAPQVRDPLAFPPVAFQP